MDIGENLQAILEERRIAIKQLSELTGISQNHLYNISKGAASLSIENLVKTANALNVSADRILGLREYGPRVVIDLSDLSERKIAMVKTLVDHLKAEDES